MVTVETEAGTAAAAAAAAAATVTNDNSGGGGDGAKAKSDVYDPNSDVIRAEKLELKREAQSQRDNLTSSDRHLLKAFFGYVAVATTAEDNKNGQIRPAKHTRKDANFYVGDALWPADLTDEQRRAEESTFVLESFLQPAIPSIVTHSVSSLEKMFRDGADMTYRQQGQLLRYWQLQDRRIFTRDLAVRTNGFARVFLSGSVGNASLQRQTNGQTDQETNKRVEKRNVTLYIYIYIYIYLKK